MIADLPPDNHQGKLEMDFSAIGIPTTHGSFAVRAEEDSVECGGIKSGDVVLMEKREPKPGDVAAVAVDGRIQFKRLTSASEQPTFGVAVGLIRKL